MISLYAGYNIESLVVGTTEVPELSRMTLVIHATNEQAEQVGIVHAQ